MSPLSVLVFSCVLITASANAATLARYEFAVASPTQSATLSAIPTIADPAISVSSMLAKATGGPGDLEISKSSGTAFARADVTNSTLALAITNTDYIQFAMTVAGPNTMSLSSFSFTHAVDVATPLPTFVSNFSVFASFDGFATAPIDTGALYTSSGGANRSFSLTDPAFQTITDSTVTFRIYVWDDSNENAQINRIDNIAVSGTAVPEPASAVVLGVAMTGLGLRRRRA
jgi:hypothetical protein